jgi:DNA-binding FadR family transcriptional regulator
MGRRALRASQIAAEIESDILKSGAGSGARFALRKDLLTRFGASPSVINEALRILRERELIIVKPGAHGGIFVSEDVQWVQLGGINMWFRKVSYNPRDLFEARVHLEDLLARVALERNEPDDFRSIEWAFEDLKTSASSAREYWEANSRLHLAIGRAAKSPVLFEMYHALVISLGAGMMQAAFVEGHEEMLQHNIGVHGDLISAIRKREPVLLEKALTLHRHDMVRASDKSWSPAFD